LDDEDEEYLIDDDIVKEKVVSSRKRKRGRPRNRSRSGNGNATKKKVKKRRKRSVVKKQLHPQRIECFKCKEESAVDDLILFVCCDKYYHLQCAGYTTSRTQRAIQQHIDNGTINKQCPVCIKKGKRTQG